MGALHRIVVLVALAAACTSSSARRKTEPPETNAAPLLRGLKLSEPRAPFDPNGAGDGAFALSPALRDLSEAEAGRFAELAGRPDTVHPRICDLVWFSDSLFLADAVQPIEETGARVHRWRAGEWSLALDWDRDGGPVTFDGGGRGGGEGFTRIRAIGGRLFVADADTPGPGGYGLSSARYEDYAFVSDSKGRFSPLAPGMKPPPGTRVMPGSFHTFDVIDYRGALVASGGTGAYPTGPYPGALWVAPMEQQEMRLRHEVGGGYGVLRTTYMHRFAGRLFIGLQNNSSGGRRLAPWDMAVWTGDPLAEDTPAPALVRVTKDGGWLTRRFASDEHNLFWIASGYRIDGRPATLFHSSDGRRFEPVPLPPDAGRPQDMVVLGKDRYLLTHRGLYRARGDLKFERIAEAPADDPFGRRDTFCSAPLVATPKGLFAGGTRTGRIFGVVPVTP